MRRSSRAALATAGLTLVLGSALRASRADPGARQKAVMSRSAPTQAQVATGHRLFLNNCAPCHGANAQGDDGPSLHHLPLSAADLFSTISNGIKGEMPAFKGKLKDPDIKAIAAYVHSLAGK